MGASPIPLGRSYPVQPVSKDTLRYHPSHCAGSGTTSRLHELEVLCHIPQFLSVSLSSSICLINPGLANCSDLAFPIPNLPLCLPSGTKDHPGGLPLAQGVSTSVVLWATHGLSFCWPLGGH